MNRRIKIVVIICIVAAIIAVYLHYENNALQISNYEVASDKIPKEFDDYKIIQISDFHNETSDELTNSLIETIKDEKPDAIAITGDFIDSRRTKIDTALNFIKKIKGVAPIYYVPGNHESRIGKYTELKDGLEKQGVIVLNNKVKKITKNKKTINLLGINDPNFPHKTVGSNSKVIKNELASIDYNKNSFNILLSHRPELYKTYVEEKMNLVLTGHAHGGQIRLPFIGALYAPVQGILPKYTSGKFKNKETTMIVSRGIGNSLFPFRVNNRPELVIVSLKAK